MSSRNAAESLRAEPTARRSLRKRTRNANAIAEAHLMEREGGPRNRMTTRDTAPIEPSELRSMGTVLGKISEQVFKNVKWDPTLSYDDKVKKSKQIVLLGLLQAYADTKHDFSSGRRCVMGDISQTIPKTLQYETIMSMLEKEMNSANASIARSQLNEQALYNEDSLMSSAQQFLGSPNFMERTLMDSSFFETLHGVFGKHLAFIYDQGALPKGFFTDLRRNTNAPKRINLHTIASDWDEAAKYLSYRVSVNLKDLPSTSIRYMAFEDSGIEFTYCPTATGRARQSCTKDHNKVQVYNGLILARTYLSEGITKFSVAQLCGFMKAVERKGKNVSKDAVGDLAASHLLVAPKMLRFFTTQTAHQRDKFKADFIRALENYKITMEEAYQSNREKKGAAATPVNYVMCTYGLCYDIKRSMDSGQCDMANAINKHMIQEGDSKWESRAFVDSLNSDIQETIMNNTRDLQRLNSLEKCFVITGDRLCFLRAKIERVPAILLHPATNGSYTATVFCNQEPFVSLTKYNDKYTEVSSLINSTRAALQPAILTESLNRIKTICKTIELYHNEYASFLESSKSSKMSVTIVRVYHDVLGIRDYTHHQSIDENLHQLHIRNLNMIKTVTSIYEHLATINSDPFPNILAKLNELHSTAGGNPSGVPIGHFNYLINMERFVKFLQHISNAPFVAGLYFLDNVILSRFDQIVTSMKTFLVQFMMNLNLLARSDAVNPEDQFPDDVDEGEPQGFDESLAQQYSAFQAEWNQNQTIQGQRVADDNRTLVVNTLIEKIDAFSGLLLELQNHRLSGSVASCIAILTDEAKALSEAAIQINSTNIPLSFSVAQALAREMYRKGVSSNMNVYQRMRLFLSQLNTTKSIAVSLAKELVIMGTAPLNQSMMAAYVEQRHLISIAEGLSLNNNVLDKQWLETRTPLLLQDMVAYTTGLDLSVYDHTFETMLTKKCTSVEKGELLKVTVPSLMRHYLSILMKRSASSEAKDNYRQEILNKVITPALVEYTASMASTIEQVRAFLMIGMDQPPSLPAQQHGQRAGWAGCSDQDDDRCDSMLLDGHTGYSNYARGLGSVLSSYQMELTSIKMDALKNKNYVVCGDGSYAPIWRPAHEEEIRRRVVNLSNFVHIFGYQNMLETIGKVDEDEDDMAKFMEKEGLYRRVIDEFQAYETRIGLNAPMDYSAYDTRESILQASNENLDKLMQILASNNRFIQEFFCNDDIRDELAARLSASTAKEQPLQKTYYPPTVAVAGGDARNRNSMKPIELYYAKYYKTYLKTYYTQR